MLLSILITVYSIGFYRLLNASKCHSVKISSKILIWSGSIGFVLIWHSQIIYKALTHWSGDSFYDLNQTEQFGLIVWSLLLITFLSWVSTLKTSWIEGRFNHKASTSKRPALAVHLLDIIITWALFELFYAFSPQLYYGYYLIIFDDLPLQWIAPNEFGFKQTIDKILMQSIIKFSDLLAALTLWTLILQVIWRYQVSFEEVNGSKRMLIGGGVFGAASILLSLIT